MRRIFRQRRVEAPPPGATPDEAGDQPISAVREEEVVGPPRRRLPRIWPWLLALLVLALAGIAAAYFLARDDDDDERATAATATVPDVVGTRAERATSRLLAAGFRTQLARAPSERRRGIVIRQRPSPGTALARGGTVTLVVSQGPATVAVPDVVGLPLAQAFRRLEAAELRPQARRVFSSRSRGRVIRQRPVAGTELEREQAVLLTVSRGPGRVTAPDLVGLSEAEALQRLEAAGLEANVVRVASSEPAGAVVAQNPVAGERVVRRSTVRLNVSRGSSSTAATTTTTGTTTGTTSSVATVPDVVGRSEAEAVATLEAAGFRPNTYPVESERPRGSVVSQNPQGGASARTGATVRLNISVGTQSRALQPVPDVAGLDEQSARTQLRDAGFAVRTVLQDTTDPAQEGVVLDQLPPGGTQARAGSQVTITVGVLAP